MSFLHGRVTVARFFLAKSGALLAGKMRCAAVFSAPPAVALFVLSTRDLGVSPHNAMVRGRPKKKVERCYILVQSTFSHSRCVWCSADTRPSTTKGAHHVAEEMVTVDDRVLAHLLVHHHMLIAANARICKVPVHFLVS